MRNKKLILYYSLVVLIFSAFVFLQVAPSAIAEETGIIPAQSGPRCPEGVTNCGNYQLNDFMQLALKISDFILKIVGSLALLAFIVGGFMFLISAGNQERVSLAQKIIIGAIIGIVVVFTSYIIIGFAFKAMGVEKNWFQSTWMN